MIRNGILKWPRWKNEELRFGVDETTREVLGSLCFQASPFYTVQVPAQHKLKAVCVTLLDNAFRASDAAAVFILTGQHTWEPLSEIQNACPNLGYRLFP